MTDPLPRLHAGLDALTGELDTGRVRARLDHLLREEDRSHRVGALLVHPEPAKPMRWRRPALLGAAAVAALVTGVLTYQASSHLGGQHEPAPIAHHTAPAPSVSPSASPTPPPLSAVDSRLQDLDLIYRWSSEEYEDSGVRTDDGTKDCYTVINTGQKIFTCITVNSDGTNHLVEYSEELQIWSEYSYDPASDSPAIEMDWIREFDTLIDKVRDGNGSNATINNETVDGIPAIHISVPAPEPPEPDSPMPGPQVITDLWIDAQTYLPIKSVDVHTDSPEFKTTCHYTWLPRTPENEKAIFTPEIPENYQKVSQREWEHRWDDRNRETIPGLD